MIKIFFFSLMILCGQNAISQNGVLWQYTEDSKSLNQQQRQEVESNVKQLLSSQLLFTSSEFGNAEVKSVVNVIYSDVNTGMKKMTTAKVSMVLNALTGGVMVYSDQINTSGAGGSKEEAFSKALLNNELAKKINTFSNNSLTSINKYYTENCTEIIRKASFNINSQKEEQGISALLAIPSNSACYAESEKLVLQAWIKLQNRRCSSVVQQASAYIASNNFEEAVRLLKTIAGSTSCKAEIKEVIKQLDLKVDKGIESELALVKAMYSGEALKISQVKEIVLLNQLN